MRKILIFIILTLLSIFIYFNFKSEKNIEVPINEYKTFPPKQYLDKLEDMKVQ
ncbi:hypothetical protein [[Clostridium] colinum]|uniref:hypothetical protein n=1 Tax=[Clostridium] colinum TaxID=36835 RepID=UPI002025AE85|nr:hypothetical protein [[Clostridium] colinum]